MLNRSIKQRLCQWLVMGSLMGFGVAMAQAEPTLKQVYETAQTGRLEEAQVMMQQVLVAHPGSAKAHFVHAELSARQGRLSAARDALATAEKLAPGLPFAKPEAVKNLHMLLAAKTSSATGNALSPKAMGMSAPVAPASPFPWGLALALSGGAIALVIFLTRKKPAPAYAQQTSYSNPEPSDQGGLGGPQNFGATSNRGNNMGGATMAPAYGQPAGNGLGGRLMGGLATGLAVGAGVMAAQAIGKSLMGNETSPARPPEGTPNLGNESPANNSDMGGQNFGVNDAGAWDDSSDMASNGDGGDWDN